RFAVENWASAMANWPIFTYLGNSLLVAGVAVVVALVIAVPANYAIARLRVGGGQTLLLIVSAYIAPPVVAIVPLFLLVRTAGLMNSPFGLGLVEGLMLTPVAVWLLDGFFRSIPGEIDEAAQLDGCGPVRTLVSVLLPLITPGLAAVGIIVFILVYNDFLIPLLLTQTGSAQTLPVGIALMQGGREVMFGQMAAASLTGIIPVYLLALFAQRWLIGGLTQGSVK
ncbi:carbohydrate ABC transporter permease, partial [Microbacterium sp.]|uniref:carbohydrate ABC transporter permease n=3 Tax=Microbacteriaceae TaxID=85023 RepID=UPI003F94F23A